MTKHAYLIMAHSDAPLLQTLLRMLDDERNSIFLHVDKKSKLLEEFTPKTEKADLHVLTNRVDTRWGDVSQVETEYVLMEEAIKYRPFAYYHLLSGADLPIKTQDEIHAFFDAHQGKEFVRFQNERPNAPEKEINQKMFCWHPMSRYYRVGNPMLKICRQIVEKTCSFFPLRKYELPLYKGPNWFSITQACVDAVIEHKGWILKNFRNTFCCDELVVQTIVYATPPPIEKCLQR